MNSNQLEFEEDNELFDLEDPEVEPIGAEANTVQSRSNEGSTFCRHPITVGFTLGTKLLTMIVYFLTGIFPFSSMLTFSTRSVIIILLVAIDFWIVKNISGRLLVGLRYWNHVDENGKSQWIFEANEDRSSIDLVDSYVFWGSLYLWPVYWIACAILALVNFSFTSFFIIFFTFTIASVNAYGYTKCLKDARQRFTSTLLNLGVQGYMNYVTNRFRG